MQNCTPCKCVNSLSNLGYACTTIGAIPTKILAMPLLDNTGNENGILLNSTFNQALWTGLINEPDASKRLYPFPTFKDVEDKRGASKTKTFKDGSPIFLREEARNFKAYITPLDGLGAVSPQLKKAIDSIRCVETGFFIVDNQNNLGGKLSSDGLSFLPRKIFEQSINALWMPADDDNPAMIELSFSFDIRENDGDLAWISCNELGGVNLNALRALLNVCSVVTNQAVDGFTAQLYTDYGTPINPGLARGLEIGDFTLHNNTDDADVTIDAVTESPEGTYSFEFAAQDPGDELELTPSKNGYDFTCTIENVIHIPLT